MDEKKMKSGFAIFLSINIPSFSEPIELYRSLARFNIPWLLQHPNE